MKRGIKLKLLFLLFFLFIVNINLSAFRLGLGYTLDTGAHIRLGKFETQVLFDKDFNVYGLRFYPLETSLKIFDFYTGIETNYISSELLDWGYSLGVFSGLDKKLIKGLHLNLDLGVFISTLKGFEEFTDWGLVINTKLTWYFLGGK